MERPQEPCSAYLLFRKKGESYQVIEFVADKDESGYDGLERASMLGARLREEFGTTYLSVEVIPDTSERILF